MSVVRTFFQLGKPGHALIQGPLGLALDEGKGVFDEGLADAVACIIDPVQGTLRSVLAAWVRGMSLVRQW